MACGPPHAERISIWDPSDESSVERIDHGAWQDILDGCVVADPSGVSFVDYAALARNPADAETLAGYLKYLHRVDPRGYSRAEQIAYWINLHGATTMKIVLDAYPVDSIEEIHEDVVPMTGPWNEVYANVADQNLTLDQLEHGILRPIWWDKRIHYAVNCAAYGCSHLIETDFTTANAELLLEAVARASLKSPPGIDFVDNDFVIISNTYDWFTEDFGGTEESVIEHLVDYVDGKLAELLGVFACAIEYDYNCGLN